MATTLTVLKAVQVPLVHDSDPLQLVGALARERKIGGTFGALHETLCITL